MEEVSPSGTTPSGTWRGLVWATLVFSLATAVLFLVYGTAWYGAGSVLMTVLGLQTLMVCTSAFLVLHANKLRTKLQEVKQWKRPEWGENAENPYKIEFDQAKIVHFLVFGILPTLVLAFLTVYVMLKWTKPTRIFNVWMVPPSHAVLISILTMVCCIIWLILARSYDGVSEENQEITKAVRAKEGADAVVALNLPEAQAMAEASWESCWWMGLTSLVLLIKGIWPAGEPVLYWAIMWWMLCVALEQVIRLFMGWMTTKSTQDTFATPVNVFLRYMVFVRGNPINSLFYTIEKKWGVSFRSSWAIRFVAKATVPVILLVLLLSWGLSSLYVVRVNEFGVRRDCGKICKEILQPGLHVKYPWPFGSITSYPVKQVSMMPIGFEQSGSAQLAYLWTQCHEAEFELVLGDGTESVAVNAMVHYKIREDKDGFFQYVLCFQNPTEAISDYAHRCLTELTRSSTLENVLAVKRDEFSAELLRRLQKYTDDNELGVEIVEVAILNLHPPVKAAEAYLDVISAGIDAKKVEIIAQGERDRAIFESQQKRDERIADAQVAAAESIANAGAETAELIAAGKSYAIDPESFQLCYWIDNIQSLLQNKRLVLVDKSVDVFFDMQKKKDTNTNRNVLMKAE